MRKHIQYQLILIYQIHHEIYFCVNHNTNIDIHICTHTILMTERSYYMYLVVDVADAYTYIRNRKIDKVIISV